MCDEPTATSDVACQATIDKQPQIISRAEAKAAGLKRYFLGTPCLHGHLCERWVNTSHCIQCLFESNMRWIVKNPDKVREIRRRHELKRSDYRKEWVAKNPEKCREAVYRWRAKNPVKTRIYDSRRRARKLNADGSHTHEQILDLFKKQKGKCLNCLCSIKSGYHIDHIMPLVLGGSNWITNIALLCQPCNNRKHVKDPIVWAQQNGRLL